MLDGDFCYAGYFGAPMYQLCVIGNPITHSISPRLHTQFGAYAGIDVNYSAKLCQDTGKFVDFATDFVSSTMRGANVTLPFKEDAFLLCKGRLTPSAKAARAVNTLYYEDGCLCGDNTDGLGLVRDLQAQGVQLKSVRVGILGAGGATRGVILPLLQAGVEHLVIANRTPRKADALIQDFAGYFGPNQHLSGGDFNLLQGAFDLIINATSAGALGEDLALPAGLKTAFAYEMMYGKPSGFLAHFEAQGARTSDGMGMLINQGALSFERWTGCAIGQDFIFEA